MRDFAGIIIVGVIAIVLLFNVFGDDRDSLRGISGSHTADTYGGLPSEPARSEIIDTIKNSDAATVEQLIREAFPLLDTVDSNNGISKIYMTKELSLPKLAELLSNKITPEEVSNRSDNKQVLVYEDDFVILQESEEEPGLILIELSSDQFVRNNYSPSFFNGLMAYALLNRMLDSDNWARKRQSMCRASGNCYGGYTMYGGYRSGSGSLRGSSNRGGGPGVGK